jgi:hypothetical protein
MDPTHITCSGAPSAVVTFMPGTMSSIATWPRVVWIRVPWAKAENADSKAGVAGPICSDSCTLPSDRREAIR